MLGMSRRFWDKFSSYRKTQPRQRGQRPRLETLEERLPPAHNIIIQAGGSSLLSTPGVISFSDTNDYTIDPADFAGIKSNITLRANNDIIIKSPIVVAQGFALTAQAGRDVVVEANVSTFNATLLLQANDDPKDGDNQADRDAGVAALSTDTTINPSVTLSSGGGSLGLFTDVGTGVASGGAITLNGGILSAGSGNITVGADTIDLGAANSVSGTGDFFFLPSHSDRPIQFGGSETSSKLVFTEADRLALKDGFAFIGIGSTVSYGDITTGGDLTPFTTSLEISSTEQPTQGNITITNTIDTGGGSLSIVAGHSVTIGTGADLKSDYYVFLDGSASSTETNAAPVDVDGGIVDGEDGTIYIGGTTDEPLAAGSATVFCEVQNNGELMTSTKGQISLTDRAPAGSGDIGFLITTGGRVVTDGGTSSDALDLNATSTITAFIGNERSTGSGYQFIHVDGAANLGGANLDLTTSDSSVLGTIFSIVQDSVAGAITGTFSGLAAGSDVTPMATGSTATYQASYSANGEAAQLTTIQAPSITLQPQDQDVPTDSTVTFTAAATGMSNPTVQWQTSTDGKTFTDVVGATSTTLTFVPTEEEVYLWYRALFTGNNVTIATRMAQLHVEPFVVHLSNETISEFRPAGTVIGTFTSDETDTGHTFTYALNSFDPYTNNTSFSIIGNELVSASAFSSAYTSTLYIGVLATDEQDNTRQDEFAISILPDKNLSFYDETLTIPGTSGNDVFSFVAGPQQDTMTLNGTTYAADSSLVSNVVFQGNGGNDTAYLTGLSTGTNTLALTPGAGAFSGTPYSVTLSNVQTIQTLAKSGDVAYLYDSSGQNTFVATPSYGFLAGAAFYYQEVGFSTVNAFAASGTNDTAYLYDASGGNAFVGTPTYSYFTNSVYFNQAVGFKAVNAFAAKTSNDAAYFFDSGGTNTFVGAATYSYLQGSAYFDQVVGFKSVYATAGSGADDSAYLFGGASGNVFIGTATYGYMYGSGFLNDALGYKTVSATGSKGDTANLYDNTGTNIFSGQGASGALSVGGLVEEATGFGFVNIVQSKGSLDQAFLNSITFILTKYGTWH